MEGTECTTLGATLQTEITTESKQQIQRTSLNDLLKASVLYGKPVYHIPIQSVDFLKRTGNSSKYGMQ